MQNIKSARERREKIKLETGVDTAPFAGVLPDKEENVRIENLMGGIALPMGVAGPVSIGPGTKDVYIPLATTEGALVASVNRGCKAIRQAGNLNITVERPGTTRSPVFFTGTLEAGSNLKQWIAGHEEELAEVAKATSRHIRLLSVLSRIAGPYTYVLCAYDTGDAMGMNMATIATEAVAQYIVSGTGTRLLALAGNVDSDKKPSWNSVLDGRGFSVHAETELADRDIETILKTDAQSLFDVWLGKCLAGSAVAGSLGFNAHFANIIAALYAATGQDLAHVVEGSTGMTMMQRMRAGIRVSVYIPSVLVGTVGGGTKLITQTAARNLTGAVHADEFAKVVGVAVLAGEISLLASLAEGSLARTHKKLGR